MKILVLVKQVPDMESRFVPVEGGGWYQEEDIAFRMNEYDEYAVEEAVSLKEKLGEGCELTVLSMGPERTVDTVRRALAMGCGSGVHILDSGYKGRDSAQTASAIAAYASGKGFDLIFTGNQSQDMATGQVGPMLAEALDMPCVTTVVKFEYEDGKVSVQRELEGGVRARVSVSAPAVITCHLGLNKPRYPTLPSIMKAKKKPLETISADGLVKDAQHTTPARMFAPEKRKAGLVLEGEIGAQVEKLMEILRERNFIPS